MLDVQVRGTFLYLHTRFGVTTLFITHDLSTVAQDGGGTVTLLPGHLVDEGGVERVMTQPEHAHTRLLPASVPVPVPDLRGQDRVEPADGGEPRIVGASES